MVNTDLTLILRATPRQKLPLTRAEAILERITAQWTDAPHAPTLSHACGWLKYGALFSEFQAFRTAESKSRLKPVPALLK